MQRQLSSAVQNINGVGPKAVALLQKLGLETIEDCLYYFPREYDDRRQLPLINQVKTGQVATVVGFVETIKERSVKKGVRLIEAVISDPSGKMTAIWFNQPYLLKVLFPGRKIIIKGKIERTLFNETTQIQVQNTEVMQSQKELKENTGIVMPVYALTAGLYQSQIRNIIKEALTHYLKHIQDNLPVYIKTQFNLIELTTAIKYIHFPPSVEAYKQARNRVVFDEFIYYQIRLEKQRIDHKKYVTADPLTIQGELLQKYLNKLPYSLTGAQERVIEDIKQDLAQRCAMNRLLQGDVGSGKTDVAILTLLCAIQSQKSGVIMAPTEILATQHYIRIQSFLSDMGIQCCLLKSKMKKAEKQHTLECMQSEKPCIVVGTHALIQENVNLEACGVIIIDEQHRFGVMQRITLQKKGQSPHCLFMTATPIPRTFMLTCFGDLDKSIIDEMPPGRIPAKTLWVNEEQVPNVYQLCGKQLYNGDQLYIVYPLVEESEKLDLKSALDGFETIKKTFPEFKVGLLHGRMHPDEKQEVMEEFKKNQIQILVSTTVIEVGIDVPNASLIIIQDAERFGLSQLHQLRGRVGRGNQSSTCYLVSNSRSETAHKRLKAMLETSDGFKIAEYDVLIRGPGDVLGTKQAGLPSFNLADLIQDEKILITARKVAKKILAEDPTLMQPAHDSLKRQLALHADSLIGQNLN